jgi:hypothetical protein
MNAKDSIRLFFTAIAVLFASPFACGATGEISLTVEATKTPEKMIHTRESIPVKPGPLTLYYPKWIPGEHGLDGPIANVAGLKFTAQGKTILWQRDLSDVFTFHVEVPAGVDRLDVTFDYLEPSGGGMYTSAVSATDKLIVIEWNQNVFYPAGPPVSQLMFHPTLILPEGWKFGTPQQVENQSGNEISFAPLSLERLVDSPVIAGQYYRAIDLAPPGEAVRHEIDIVADGETALNMSPEIGKEMTNLVAEAGKLLAHVIIANTVSCWRSAITSPTLGSSTTNATIAACQSASCLGRILGWRSGGCWRTDMRTPGAGSFAARLICPRPITKRR